MRLLIVEDNSRLALLLKSGLEEHGFLSEIAFCLEEADAAMRDFAYDALILDLGMPDGDGIDWLAHRRQRGCSTPALILTARGRLDDRIAGLDSGADDYLVKPVDGSELAARVRAVLRRPGGRAHSLIDLGRLTFDTISRTARVDGQPVDLSRREGHLIELLMRRAGHVVPRAVIDHSLYGFDQAVTPNAVEAMISRLRRKLEDQGLGGTLHTVRGIGYMMMTAPGV